MRNSVADSERYFDQICTMNLALAEDIPGFYSVEALVVSTLGEVKEV